MSVDATAGQTFVLHFELLCNKIYCLTSPDSTNFDISTGNLSHTLIKGSSIDR